MIVTLFESSKVLLSSAVTLGTSVSPAPLDYHHYHHHHHQHNHHHNQHHQDRHEQHSHHHFTIIFDIITIMVRIIWSLVKICNRFYPMRKSREITAPRKLPTTDLKSYPPFRIFTNNMDHPHHEDQTQYNHPHHQCITAITQVEYFHNPGAYLQQI